MDKEYKTLVNKALERFHFRLNASGAHAERAARESLTRAIKSLYDTAFYVDDRTRSTSFPYSSAPQKTGPY
ncbi:DUF4754 family protein [Escherichia phage 503458]|uniref:DUF4754 family protein n=1 Tax=Escherichia phage 503458 TaxID=2716350 RepID=UPI0018AD213F|nr:DUF4754 family protein [Escherichia phage 503458]